MDINFNKIKDLLKDVDLMRENKKSLQEVNDTPLFEYSDDTETYNFDESLLTTDGFIQALKGNDTDQLDGLTGSNRYRMYDANNIDEDELAALYDAVAELDGAEGMS